jgi:hypothetical protein
MGDENVLELVVMVGQFYECTKNHYQISPPPQKAPRDKMN